MKEKIKLFAIVYSLLREFIILLLAMQYFHFLCPGFVYVDVLQRPISVMKLVSSNKKCVTNMIDKKFI